MWVAEQMGLRKFEIRERKEPRWKRRIENEIRRLRHDVNILSTDLKGELGKKKRHKLRDLEEKYRVKTKGIRTVIEELKQRMLAKSAKIKRYEQRITQFRQNRIFNGDQKKIYTELNGGEARSTEVPNAEESKKFWSDIWSVDEEHKRLFG